jgi:hypothetical protein
LAIVICFRPQAFQATVRRINAKGVPSHPTTTMIEAYRAAIGPLTELVAAYGEPSDHELLGMCHLMIGDEESAGKTFRAGLAIEQERNPNSDLCGAFMKRIASL